MRRFCFLFLLVGSFWLLGSTLGHAQVPYPVLDQMGVGNMRILADDEVPRSYGPIIYLDHHGRYVHRGPPYAWRPGGMTPSQAQWIRSTITRQRW